MIKLRLNDEKRVVYDSFSDITLQHLRRGYEIFSYQDKDIKNFFLKEGSEIKESKLFDFYIDWLSIFSDLTKNELRNISVESNIDLSLQNLFSYTKKFIYSPEHVIDLKELTHKGKKYSIIEDIKTINGARLYFGNYNYNQFKLSAQLSSSIEGVKNGNAIDSLVQLLAIIYTDGDNSNAGIDKRILAFKDLNALYGWSGWFFFALLTTKYKNYFQSYSNNQAEAVLKMKKENLKRSICKLFTGKFMRTMLQKTEFSILKD
jgi:hypothetical protein